MKAALILMIGLALALAGCSSPKDPNVIEMYALTDSGTGAPIGTVTVSETAYGTLLTPDLHDLTPGLHGFHLHAVASCEPAEKEGRMVPGLAAGGHFDPSETKTHQGPYGEGHLGDLPALYADGKGRATLPVLAPRLKPADIRGRSLIVHAGGDNYADRPAPLGGGGSRVACGIAAQAEH